MEHNPERDRIMTHTTAQAGTTADLLEASTVAASVSESLAGWEADFDMTATIEDYRTEITAVAPAGLDLAGDTIIADTDMDADRLDTAMDAWRDAISRIDLWVIAASHDTTKEA